MDINSRVDHMDEELQLLKNEIKQVLLEIQEHVLNIQNPFSGGGVASLGNFATSEPAPAEPVFTEPLIPEPEPELPAPAPAPAATEVSITTQTETVAPVAVPVAPLLAPAAAPVAAPVAAPAAAPVAPAAPAGPVYTGGGAPAGGMGGYSGPAFVPPSAPSMPFVPPGAGFGGPGLGPTQSDFDDRDRDRIRELERDRDRDRVRELERKMDQKEDRDLAGDGQDTPVHAGFPENDTLDETDSDATFVLDDGGQSDSSRDFADVIAGLEDEVGMPGLPPSAASPKASGGATPQTSESDSQDGGSLGPPGMVFSLPGLNIDGKAVDLLTTAGLIQWAYSVLAKVGSENMFSLLELSALTGRIPEETRDILLSVMPIFEMGGLAENVTVKDIIATLAELDGFMGNISPEDTRLLPFLLQEEMDVFPLIRPR